MAKIGMKTGEGGIREYSSFFNEIVTIGIPRSLRNAFEKS